MDHRSPVPSRAAIAGHPIHPMLIPFPMAFLVGAFFCDLGYWGTEDPFWARASFWLIASGLATGLLAGLFGAVDFVTLSRPKHVLHGWVHAVGNIVVLLLAAVNLYLREEQVPTDVLPWGLLLSLATVLLLGITGWMGGELSYRYQVGVLPAETDQEERTREPE
ncbi:DUF2231 domain-containing protein [Telmatospirillum sp. J64-1]|uniref:DUF2231 domain-containing protein n=1 Tax=Telmatospirillum sp. J64-1 TaxID=2502183 RepID=UPI00115D2F85|nr:DUF2231 domain-containing protein [Telmatospirillum sp. J64-1]